jgi:ubiquinone/menaquinone biosynthesis C-methylase UbiE/membrane protein YqaA with SNARE-associated domain
MEMYEKVLELLTGTGYIGIIIAGFTEAIFMPFPMEVVYIPIALADPGMGLKCTALLITSSFIGSIAAYWIGKFTGQKLVYRLDFVKRNFKQIKNIYDKNSFFAIMTSAFTPIPYEAYTLTAGIFNIRFKDFLVASILSRIIRYVPQGVLIYLYGDTVISIIKSYGILSAVILFIVIVALKRVHKKMIGVDMMDDTEKIRKRYDRVAKIYDILEQPMEAMSLKRWRLEVAKDLSGKVLEVGVGTGKNIPYYPDDIDITAIDFSGEMISKAREKAKLLNKKVELLQMDAQQMDFSDNTFDMVFTTCVFCSVPDPVKGLKEIRRICKPGGRIIMIEHVRSERKVLGLIMDVFNPLTVNLWGANINRKTVDNVQKAGFSSVKVTNLTGDIVKKIIINNEKYKQ